MIQFVCDTCFKTKDSKESWILGLAAEAFGITSERREVSILQVWDGERTVHPLAVHFCSVDCKNRYVDQLFAEKSSAEFSGTELTAAGPTAKSRGDTGSRKAEMPKGRGAKTVA